MKKLLLSAAVLAVSALTAGAADFTVKYNGQEVTAGQNITVTEAEYGMMEAEYAVTPSSYPMDIEIWMADVLVAELDGEKAHSELCYSIGLLGNCLPDANKPFTVSVAKDEVLKCQAHVFAPNDDETAKFKCIYKYFVRKKGSSDTFEFQITYDCTDDSVDAIASEENAPAEYYNLQGVRVANPDNGIYIVRRGSKVSKTVIR